MADPFVIETVDLRKNYDTNQTWGAAINLPITSQKVKILQCPSSPNPDGDVDGGGAMRPAAEPDGLPELPSALSPLDWVFRQSSQMPSA